MGDKELKEQVQRLTEELAAQKLAFQRQEDRFRQREEEYQTELNTSKVECEEAKELKTVYVTKESKKIPKLKGVPKSDDDVDVEEWLDDVRRHIRSRKLTDKEAFAFVMEHLDGPAKWEIRFRFSAIEVPLPQKVFDTISQVFGAPDSVSHLQEQFFKRNQLETEGILEYSLALLRLFDKIEKRDSSCLTQHDRFLKGKFIEGVREESLRRELRGLNIEKPDLAFWELRDWAIKWLGEDASASKVAKKKTAQAQEIKSDGAAKDLLDVVKKQQEQIDTLYKLVQESKPQPKQVKQSDQAKAQGNNSQGGQGVKSNHFKRGGFGRGRACFRCGQTDHMIRDCPVPGNQNNATGSSFNKGAKGQKWGKQNSGDNMQPQPVSYGLPYWPWGPQPSSFAQGQPHLSPAAPAFVPQTAASVVQLPTKQGNGNLP